MATRKQVIELFDRHADFLTPDPKVKEAVRAMLETAPDSKAVIAAVYRHALVWNLSPDRREQLILVCKGKNPLEKEKKPGARA